VTAAVSSAMLQKAFDRWRSEHRSFDLNVHTANADRTNFGGSEAFSKLLFDLCLSSVCSFVTANTLRIVAIHVQLPVRFQKVALLTVSLKLKIWH